MFIPVNDFSSMYKTIMRLIIKKGSLVVPRKKQTREIRPVVLGFLNPLKRVVTCYGRDNNTFFNIAEALWILSGREDVSPMKYFASNISQFSDDGMVFHAPYGARLRKYGQSMEHKTIGFMTVYDEEDNSILKMHEKQMDFTVDQLQGVVSVLQKDRDSRQAVAAIWCPFYDLQVDSKDIPCNDLLFFKIRDNKLEMTVCNRSNDYHWGLLTNLFQFSMIQDVLAAVLQVGVGGYAHLTDSLHVYLDDYSAGVTQKIESSGHSSDFSVYEYGIEPKPFQFIPIGDVPEEKRFEIIFDYIEISMSYIDESIVHLENLIRESREKEVIASSIYQNEVLNMVGAISPTLKDYLLLVTAYILHKNSLKYRDDIKTMLMLRGLASELIGQAVTVPDMQISCFNFLATRFDNESNEKLKFDVQLMGWGKEIVDFIFEKADWEQEPMITR